MLTFVNTSSQLTQIVPHLQVGIFSRASAAIVTVQVLHCTLTLCSMATYVLVSAGFSAAVFGSARTLESYKTGDVDYIDVTDSAATASEIRSVV